MKFIFEFYVVLLSWRSKINNKWFDISWITKKYFLVLVWLIMIQIFLDPWHDRQHSKVMGYINSWLKIVKCKKNKIKYLNRISDFANLFKKEQHKYYLPYKINWYPFKIAQQQNGLGHSLNKYVVKNVFERRPKIIF
jgi:hypothetical protein